MPFDAMPAQYDLVNSKADRLRYLADFIETRRDDEIYMPGYENGCGTARCALGWAVTLPAFKALGVPSDPGELHLIGHAGGAFFGVDYADHVSRVWMAAAYPYPADAIPARAVAKRLRKLADKVAAREFAALTAARGDA